MSGKKVLKRELAVVWAGLRSGCSLYAACLQAGMTTKVFYRKVAHDAEAMEEFRLAMADYADQCMDDIRKIVASLKAGEVDNSTAKLLIETQKWLALKASPENGGEMSGAGKKEDGADGVEEIVVKFV
ncbi:MAG: hypothetical protein J6C85_00835 [Alphaproteobacteria bacterium]|nr:hypothetical protein [Alphaproteobacteria bacterium]